MKISAMPSGASGTPGADLNSSHIGVTASAERLAAAKAIASGQEPVQPAVQDPVERALNIRKITMKTNASPTRYEAPVVETTESTISDTNGQANATAESTRPLSPQFAALAKERRALQVMKKELDEQKQAQSKPPEGDYIAKADLLANPLKIFDAGLTYDQLTEAILSSQSGITPEIQSLKEELKRVKEDVNKTLSDRDAQAESQALAEMRKDAQSLIQTGDDYEMVRETQSLPHVIELIRRTYKTTGEILDVREALNLVETDLITETLKVANLKKVKSQIAPEPVQQPQSQGKQMKTLTNRDSASVPLDRKARAIAAMQGTLRK